MTVHHVQPDRAARADSVNAGAGYLHKHPGYAHLLPVGLAFAVAPAALQSCASSYARDKAATFLPYLELRDRAKTVYLFDRKRFFREILRNAGVARILRRVDHQVLFA